MFHLKPNIDVKGKKARLYSGLVVLGVGLGFFFLVGVSSKWFYLMTTVLCVTGLFMIFEALKGWCLLRACGFKTKI